MFNRLCAIDPSLTSSGWVLFDVSSEKPIRAGTVCALSGSLELAIRLSDFQHQVQNLFEELMLGAEDIVILEAPAPLVLNPDSAMKVEQVRGIFESVARSRNVLVPGRINPRTVQSEMLGLRGKQAKRAVVKDCARQVVKRFYGDSLNELVGLVDNKQKLSQDIIDAALIGAVALSRVKMSGYSDENLIATLSSYSGNNRVSGRRKVRWTTNDIKVLDGSKE